MGLLMNGPFWSFYSQRRPYRAFRNLLIIVYIFLPKLQFHSSFCLQVPALVSGDFLCLPVCFCNLRGDSLSYVLTSLMDPSRVVNFSVCSLFICCQDEVVTSKILTHGTENKQSLCTVLKNIWGIFIVIALDITICIHILY